MEEPKINRRYNSQKTFEYNKQKGPFETIKDRNEEIAKILGNYGINTNFFGFKTKLPIGVAAGPIYNNEYMKGAIKDGFEVITWKTFRSKKRLAHHSQGKHIGHNILFVPPDQLTKQQLGKKITGFLDFSGETSDISITNSFGMPSDAPLKWLPDVLDMEEYAKKKKKLIITSVVGTPKENGTIEELANDYAFLAHMAKSVGSTIIELNLSCPNVSGGEGIIYKDPESSKIIVKRTRELLNDSNIKLLVKVGYGNKNFYKKFLKATAEYIDGVVAINTIPMHIVDENGNQALPGGEISGVCGKAILKMSVKAVANLCEVRNELFLKEQVKIIGCGGVMDTEAFIQHINAGAEFVMCATAALFNPELPIEIAQHIHDNKININI